MAETFVTRSKLKARSIYFLKKMVRAGRSVEIARCGKGKQLRYVVAWL